MVGIQVVKPSDIESTTMSKVTWRLVPFLMLCYFIAYLDRVKSRRSPAVGMFHRRLSRTHAIQQTASSQATRPVAAPGAVG